MMIDVGTEMSRAPVASASVAGSFSSTASMTGSPERLDSPRSPRNTFPPQIRYCTGSDSSSPISALRSR